MDYMQEQERAEESAARAAREQEALLQDINNTFTSPYGRRVFWHLLARCHFIEPVSRTNSTIYQLAAERDFGLELMGLLGEANPGLLADILTMGLRQRQAEIEKEKAEQERQK